MCGQGQETFLPTRILDVSASKVRLCERDDQLGRYAALSHCWGGRIAAQTTSATHAAFKEQIPWNQLPKTFQDAITFTRNLGLQYIWIDSLCIIQDSRSDWHRESAKMKQVYQGAYITLAATASKNSHSGCFETAAFKSRAVAQVRTDNGLVDLYTRRRWRHIWSTESAWMPLSAPWYPLLTRAWVFQERLLSSRVVHFTTNELMWECREERACECSGFGKADDKNSKSIKLKFNPGESGPAVSSSTDTSTVLSTQIGGALQVQSFGPWPMKPPERRQQSGVGWSEIISDYSSLSLSFHADRLPALSGIAKTLFVADRGKYFAGLWESELPESLLWFARQPSSWRPESKYPSWSWASVQRDITAHDSSRGMLPSTCVTVHEIQCSLASEDPHGEVLGGRLVISGELNVATCVSASAAGPNRHDEVVWLKYHDAAPGL
jgi:hypothetical protein